MRDRKFFDVIASPPSGGAAYGQSFGTADEAAAYARTLDGLGYDIEQHEIELARSVRDGLEEARRFFKDATIPDEPSQL